MSANALLTSTSKSPGKKAHETFVCKFQSSGSKRQHIITQSSDESPLNKNHRENSSEKTKCQESSPSVYNSTQITDATKMVVSFQTSNSSASNHVASTGVSSKSSNNGISFFSSTGTTHTDCKPAAGKVLKNVSTSAVSTKAKEVSKQKGSSVKVPNSDKINPSQNNQRGSRSAPNSRNNSGGNPKENKKELLEMEHSAVSTDSSTHSCNSTASKLSKIGKKLRDGCRNLRGKHSSGGSSGHDPEDYTSIQAPNESLRSKHYVPMDFSGREGRICDISDIPGNQPIKEGYTYFRRKCLSGNVKNLLTETQSSIHKSQPWFHTGIGRDASQRILATHAVDGVFLVRESSVSGGFVISYYFGGRTHHAQALPDVVDGCVTYSIDDCRTRFFDLLQMVEFYQLNRGSLSTRLTHYIVSLEFAPDKDTICEKKVSSGDNRDVQNSEKLLEINQVVECIHENGASELSTRKTNAPVDLPTPSSLSIRTNSCTSKCAGSDVQEALLLHSGSIPYHQDALNQKVEDTSTTENNSSINFPTDQSQIVSNLCTPKVASILNGGNSKDDNNIINSRINNICDQYTSTNDESQNNNNNNNNNNNIIKKATPSQSVATGESQFDGQKGATDDESEAKQDVATETHVIEQHIDDGLKIEDHTIVNGISDHCDLLECEKEKHPKNE